MGVSQSKNHTKLIFIILLMVAIFTSAVMYFGLIKPSQAHRVKEVKINGIFLPTPKAINDFQLSDHNGKPFSKDNLKGKWTMMFFGFTNCGYVCPTTLAELNIMYQTLKKTLPDNQLPQVVLVSVDPERDSIEKMHSYINAFNPHFVGVRADLAETVALEKQLHISAIKMQAEGDGKNHYMINHTAEILLINPSANVQAYFSFPHKADQMVKDYKLILANI